MTERKTLNKYYPKDFDPAKIPKLKGKQKEANRLWGIRVMAPFNMRCNTCAEYIYKGKKFNSKKETVSTEDYLGIQIHRFYIRCPKCVAVIAFKTDPQNCDYTLESGATRNFEAAKTLQEMEKKKQKALEEEEAANPMKVLENRTKQSKNEMDMMEALTELRELNARHEKVDHEGMIKKAQLVQQELERLQKAEEDRLIRELFGTSDETNSAEFVRRIEDDNDDDDEDNCNGIAPHKMIKMSTSKPSDLLVAGTSNMQSTKDIPLQHKKPKSTSDLLSNLVKVKKNVNNIINVEKKSNISPTELTSKNDSCTKNAATALGALGAYSSSESDAD